MSETKTTEKEQETLPEKKQSKEIVKHTPALPASPINFGADVAEINGADMGYLDRFSKLMYFDNTDNEFVVSDQLSESFDEIWRGQEFTAIVLYQHAVVRLTQGAIDGKERNAWSDDDKKIVAATYASPYYVGGSKGSFSPNYLDYLSNEDKRKSLVNKAYFFLVIPELFGQEIIPASFGGSVWKSYQKVSKLLTSFGYPVPSVQLKVSLVKDKQKGTGQPYKRVNFETIQTKDGKLLMSVKDQASWERNLKPKVNELKKAHMAKVQQMETIQADIDAIETTGFEIVDESEIGF